MSTVQDKIKAIKALFNMDTPPAPLAAPAPAALGSYKLADGTEVGISELTVGGIVTIGDAPAPAGEHMLEDGTKIKLDDMGVIVEIEAATPAAPATPAMPQMPEEMSQLVQRMEAAEAKIGEFAAKFDIQATLISGLTEANKQLVELMEQFANTPTGNPVEPAQQKFGKAGAESKEDRLARITASLKTLKK